MKELKARAIVASEYPELRHCFAEVVQDELGGMVVGEADNAVRAVALARTLRPDLMMVDDCLPYIAGLDGVRLSRIGGLDAAEGVVQALPRARVLLVSHMEAALAVNNGGGRRVELCLYRRPSSDGGQPKSQVVFAALREKAMPGGLRRKVMTVSEKGMLVGGLSLLGGFGLMFTVLLFAAGVVLAAAGVGLFLVSWGAWAAAAAWPTRDRSSEGRKETQEERDDIDAGLQGLPVI